MPAQIVLVHDGEPFRATAAQMLRDAGYQVAEYPDALAATDALERAEAIELLITRARFGEGRSSGAALVRMVKLRNPQVRVIFVAGEDVYEEVKELGVFLSTPVALIHLLVAVRHEIGIPPNEGEWPFTAP